MKLVTLKKRRDFVLSNKYGQKTQNKYFILQKYLNPNISDASLDAKSPQLFPNFPIPSSGSFLVPSGKINIE